MKRVTPRSLPRWCPQRFQGRFVLRAQVLIAERLRREPAAAEERPPQHGPRAQPGHRAERGPRRSTGQPFQSFPLANAPVYPGSTVGHGVRALDAGRQPRGRGRETLDLFGAGPNDRVYELIPDTGEILFGDGTSGMIPPPDDGSQPTGNIIAPPYQYGGGLAGNVGASTLTSVLADTGRGVVRREQRPAGGRAATTRRPWRSGVARAPAVVRSRYRAVSAADFEALAMETPDTRRRARQGARQHAPRLRLRDDARRGDAASSSPTRPSRARSARPSPCRR